MEKINIHKITPILLLIYLFINKYLSIEISYIIGIFLLIFSFSLNKKLNYSIYFIIINLLIITCIGFIKGIFNHNVLLKDFIKDFIYYTKPIVSFLCFYNLMIINKKNYFFTKLIFYLAIISAIVHLTGTAYYIFYNGFSISGLRDNLGLGNNIEVLAFILLLNKNKNSILYYNLKYRNIFLIIIIFSIILYFSRTDFILLLILFLGTKGYYRPTLRIFSYFFGAISIILLFFYALNFIEVKSNQTNGIYPFLFKLKNTQNEMFKSKINKNNLSDVYHNWRAYEVIMAVDQTKNSGIINQIFGNGFGSLVDLKLKVFLGDSYMRKIPILHNGYIYIYYKTGYIGLFIYIFTFLGIFKLGFTGKKGEKYLLYLISSMALCILFSTLVVTGIYNKFDLLMLYLGGFLALHKKSLNRLSS